MPPCTVMATAPPVSSIATSGSGGASDVERLATARVAVNRAWVAVISSANRSPRAAPSTPNSAAMPTVSAQRVTASMTRLIERSL